MKLDSRILEGKKPLDCFDVDIAKQFIGKKGYFCDHRSGFTNISNLVEDVLRDITPDDNYCEVYKTNCTSWEYFLPEEWIKEPEEKPEKKYRPYTLAEWIGQHTIGDVIRYRCKSQKIELRHLYVGYAYGIGKNINEIGVGTLTLGVASYTFNYLFEDFELFYNGRWLPFGVLDNGEKE